MNEGKMLMYESAEIAMYFYQHDDVPVLCVVILSHPQETLGVSLSKELCNSFVDTFRSDLTSRNTSSTVVKRYKRAFQPISQSLMNSCLQHDVLEVIRISVGAKLIVLCYSSCPSDYVELCSPCDVDTSGCSWACLQKLISTVGPQSEICMKMNGNHVMVLVFRRELYITVMLSNDRGGPHPLLQLPNSTSLLSFLSGYMEVLYNMHVKSNAHVLAGNPTLPA
eukprot:PhF_6_TR41506/c0_g1_i1/m.62901